MNATGTKERYSSVNPAALIVLLIVLAGMAGGCAGKVGQEDSLDTFADYLSGRIEIWMERYDVPGVSISLIQDGEIAWSQAYGYADREQGRRMTVDTACRTQSITKSLTAWGVMRLVEQGRIGLDDPVAPYIRNWVFPDTEYPVSDITVRQLLTHTSGIYLGTIGIHYPPTGDVPSLEENLYREVQMEKAPGKTFLYSNVGYNLLELLIEEVTGQDFAEYMEQEVLLPLGMDRASFTWREDFSPPVPSGYDLTGTPVPAYVYPEKASGGLFANVEDVARFVIADMGHNPGQDVLTPEGIETLQTPMVRSGGQYALVSEAYGFGHFIETLPNGSRGVFHGGQGHGWMTHFHAVPEAGAAIVILTNSQRSWPVISFILNDWARWCGFSSVGMTLIAKGITVLWVLVGLVFALSLWLIGRLARGIKKGRRLLKPLVRDRRGGRIVQAAVSVALIAGIVYCMGLDYTFMSAVFPLVYPWIGASLFALAAAMLLSAVFPRRKDADKSE